MKLSDMEFIKLLPAFMRNDGAIIGLSLATDEIVKILSNSAKKLTTWDKIDELSEAEIDLLADELNILWYNKTASINVKRELVKNSDKVYQKLGTKWAVENVINTYFGSGYISEWFEYAGEPGHFKVFSTNQQITNERMLQFLDILWKVKRGSAHLDGIFITLTGKMELHTGNAYREAGRESVAMGSPLTENMPIHAGVAYREIQFERYQTAFSE